MALVNMKEILRDASRRGYGVGAFNLLGMEAVKGAVRAAEKECSPLIMQLAEIQLEGSPMHCMIPMMVQAAKEAGVPVAVHFDHGVTLEAICRALQFGCTSVMFDGAALPFEENIRQTREAVRIAHAMGASCEAELGVVGGAESVDSAGSEPDEMLLTDAGQASEFVERTGCDALAVAIGNAHGPYRKKPELHFERLRDIQKTVCVPLVLHGGSGISDEAFRECIAGGIRKINVATALQQNVVNQLADLFGAGSGVRPSYEATAAVLEEGVYEEVRKHIRIFMSGGMA